MTRNSPHVLHVPHASRVVPEDVRATLLLDDRQLAHELDRSTDHATDVLFGANPLAPHLVRFPVSRLVVDPERFLDDAREPMAVHGLGVVYTRTSEGRPLRRAPTPAERADLLERFYVPHHERLTAAVDAALAAYGHCLIVDAHSFPGEPLPYEAPCARARPCLCLGTDAFHTPPWLLDIAQRAFAGSGFDPAFLNAPFSGSIVPAKHYLRDPRVHSLMVEVNRDLYWDEGAGAPHRDFVAVQLALRRALALVRGRFSLRFMP